MTGHDNLEMGGLRVQGQLSEIVKNIYGNVANIEHFGFRQLRGPRPIVVVSAHCRNGRNRSELVKYRHVTDVARVNDEVAAAKHLHRLRAQHSVGIGDQSHAEPMA